VEQKQARRFVVVVDELGSTAEHERREKRGRVTRV
jgi:hypothetical protein